MTKKAKLPPVHPREVLREDYLIPARHGERARDGAACAHQPHVRDCTLPACDHTGDGLRLARYPGTSAEFWLGLQSDYDLEKAQEEFKERIEREVQPRERAA